MRAAPKSICVCGVMASSCRNAETEAGFAAFGEESTDGATGQNVSWPPRGNGPRPQPIGKFNQFRPCVTVGSGLGLSAIFPWFLHTHSSSRLVTAASQTRTPWQARDRRSRALD